MAAQTARTQMWHEPESGSTIYLRPAGGNSGYTVKLQTEALPSQSDYLRETYCPDILFAAERVMWLMENVVPGQWVKVS